MAERQETIDKKDELYGFILAFSKKHLRFPTTPEIETGFSLSGSRLYELIGDLVADNKLEKVGRYGFGLVAYNPATLAKKSSK